MPSATRRVDASDGQLIGARFHPGNDFIDGTVTLPAARNIIARHQEVQIRAVHPLWSHPLA